MHGLAMVALYTPLWWYCVYLQTLYAGHTNVLVMAPHHVGVGVLLLVLPLLVQSSLGVKWQDRETTLPLA